MQRPDLSKIEDVLVALATKSIDAFAISHANESFYAFGIDCNAEYGNVLLCLNTEEDFALTSAQYVAEWNYGPDDLADLKRNFGDWKYQGFNLKQPEWTAEWTPYEEQIEQYVFAEANDDEGEDEADERSEEFVEDLMRCCCRVLVRLERDGVLGRLNRDQGFFTHVMDHDEDEDGATERLTNARDQFAV